MRSRISLLNLTTLHWEEVPNLSQNLVELFFHSTFLLDDKLLVIQARKEEKFLTSFDLLLREFPSVDIHTLNNQHRPVLQRFHVAEICDLRNILAVVDFQPEGIEPRLGRLRLLDLSSYSWSAPKTKGKAPTAHVAPSVTSCLVGARLLVHDVVGFGGVGGRLSSIYLAGPRKFAWEDVRFEGNVVHRFSSRLIHLGRGRIMFYGGYELDSAKFGHETYVIDDVNQEAPSWFPVREKDTRARYSMWGEPPSARKFPATVVMRDGLLLVGGAEDDRSDCFMLCPDEG